MVKIYQQPFAHAGTKQVIPDASDPQGFVSNEDGFTTDYELPDTDPNYKPIERAEFNGLMNMVTDALGELQQFGFAKWQPITWPLGARVVEGGVVYRALTQTSQQPPHADWIDDMDALILGLGTAATRDVGTASGNVMEVGAFGIGGRGTQGSLDLNNVNYNGIHAQGSGASNYFPDSLSGFALSFDYNNDYAAQLATNLMGSRWGVRGKDAGTWEAWKELIHTGNILKSTGNNNEFPMSQKAVTDAINNSAIGVGQTWQDVTGSRNVNVNYTNSTGRTIMVSFTGGDNSVTAEITVNGVVIASSSAGAGASTEKPFVTTLIPNGATYKITGTKEIWTELR